MVKFKNESVDKSLQNWFPLRIVDIKEIPSPSNMLSHSFLEVEELLFLFNLLKDFCKKQRGVGLSAVQCGIPLKVFIASVDGENFRCFVDGTYRGDGNLVNSLEGCLSLKNENGTSKRFIVNRYESITFNSKELIDNNGTPSFVDLNETVKGFFAVVIQHEVDHHEGRLISDFGKEVEIVS